MSKTSKILNKNVCTKRSRDVTFEDQGHVISRSLLLILVAYVRLHLCAKFDANRTARLRVIQMAHKRDRQSNRVTESQSNRQLHSGHHNTDKMSFSKTFCGNECFPVPSLTDCIEIVMTVVERVYLWLVRMVMSLRR